MYIRRHLRCYCCHDCDRCGRGGWRVVYSKYTSILHKSLTPSFSFSNLRAGRVSSSRYMWKTKLTYLLFSFFSQNECVRWYIHNPPKHPSRDWRLSSNRGPREDARSNPSCILYPVTRPKKSYTYMIYYILYIRQKKRKTVCTYNVTHTLLCVRVCAIRF